MPYKDPEKRKAAVKQSKQRAKEQAAAEVEEQVTGTAPETVTMEQLEAAAQIADEDERAKAEALCSKALARYSKSRTWACIIYPESLPDDWQELLMQQGVCCAISPLHDQDVTAEGKPKKAHFHVILSWPGPTSFQPVVRISKGLLHGTLPLPLVSPRGYYRYFTHKDHPNKAQYDEKAITHINGFNIHDFIDLTRAETLEIRKKLQMLIIEQSFTEYADFCDYVMFNGSDDEYEIATTQTLFFANYLRSKRHIAEAEQLAGQK